MSPEREETMAFEAEVRRVAEVVWGLLPGDCQPQHYEGANVILHELDGMARLRDITHLVMATVSRRLDKVNQDVLKLNAAEKLEQRRSKPISKWLITKHQLDAQHVAFARKERVTVLTLDNFRTRFFDGREYIQKRRVAAFGSARNLSDGAITIPIDEYVPLPIMEMPYGTGGQPLRSDMTSASLHEIVQRLRQGDLLVLIAPFGAGKSLTTRELFLDLAKRYLKDDQGQVPIAISLREQWASQFGDEILERHARSIGFTPKEDVVVAWRAGIATLLLDGFDEMASQVVAAPDNINFMREARSKALLPVRDLIGKVPSHAGVLVCGRDHYFDDNREMIQALGITGRPFFLLRLGEFTEDQANDFLKKHKILTPLPDWLPRKPLILGYLAHRGLLQDIMGIDASLGFGHAWDQFLTLICEREAAHEQAVMDPHTLRRLLEKLACDVRATSSGTGPITGRELAEAYRLETGQMAGEGVLMQLQRLPGLTPREQDPTARSFIDEDVLAALQGSAVARFVLENVNRQTGLRWLSPLSAKGIAMAAYLLRKAQADVSTVIGACLRATRQGDRVYESQIAADCFQVAVEMAREDALLDCRGLLLDGVLLGTLDLEDLQIDGLSIESSLIDEVVLGARGHKTGVQIRQCNIHRITGASSAAALPAGNFQRCEIEAFEDLSTNAAVIASDLPPAIKALVTILRKLYLQPGAGRMISAFKRGVPTGPILAAVDPILHILKSEGVINVFNEIAHPVRRQHQRIMKILDLTHQSKDSIVERVSRL